MPNVNKVILIGNLTRDPQTKQLPGRSTGPSGNSGMVAEFGLAMNRKFKTAEGEDREEVCFVDCAAFGRQAEVIAKYCKKGKQLYVEGRLRYDSWEDKSGHGKRRYDRARQNESGHLIHIVSSKLTISVLVPGLWFGVEFSHRNSTGRKTYVLSGRHIVAK